MARRTCFAARAALGPVPCALLVVLAGLLRLCGEARAADRRYAVLIGANIGDQGEARLRYSESDAEHLAQTLRSIGDFSPDETLVLAGSTADDVRQALIRLNLRVREDVSPALLFVYYSGHADEDNLHLSGTHLSTAEIRARRPAAGCWSSTPASRAP